MKPKYTLIYLLVWANMALVHGAKFETFAPVLIANEGGKTFTNFVWDMDGGGTKYGITLNLLKGLKKQGIANFDNNNDGTITQIDLHHLTLGSAMWIYKRCFWDFYALDYVNSQLVANIICDHVVMAGATTTQAVLMIKAIKKPVTKFKSTVFAQTINSVLASVASVQLTEFRWEYLKQSKSFPYAQNGWKRRVYSFII